MSPLSHRRPKASTESEPLVAFTIHRSGFAGTLRGYEGPWGPVDVRYDDHTTEVSGPHIPTFRIEMTPRQLLRFKTPWVVRGTLGDKVVIVTQLGVIGREGRAVHIRVEGGWSYRLTTLFAGGLARFVRDDGTVLDGPLRHGWRRLLDSRWGVRSSVLPEEVALMLALIALGFYGLLDAWGV